MGSRCHIAYIERDGSGKGIYCHTGCYPNDVGIKLLTKYQEERDIKALVNLGELSSVCDTAEQTATCVAEDNIPAYEITEGTQEFFGSLMPTIEWLYAWTPDGWLAARAHPGNLPYHVYALPEPEEHPAWKQADREAAERQQPRPLYQVIQEYLQEKGQPPLEEFLNTTQNDAKG